MKPHDARLDEVEANDRRDVVERNRAAGWLGWRQRREGDERRDIQDFMMMTQTRLPFVKSMADYFEDCHNNFENMRRNIGEAGSLERGGEDSSASWGNVGVWVKSILSPRTNGRKGSNPICSEVMCLFVE